jgi:hypothetical protein
VYDDLETINEMIKKMTKENSILTGNKQNLKWFSCYHLYDHTVGIALQVFNWKPRLILIIGPWNIIIGPH